MNNEKILVVTGATGLVGSNVCFHALNSGYHVRTLIRKQSNTMAIDDLNVECIYGDILDLESLKTAFKNAFAVIHVAGLVSFWQVKKQLIYKINVEGTKNIIKACIKNNIKKLIYTSSSAAIGRCNKNQKILDEQADWDYEGFMYNQSKKDAEHLIIAANNPPEFETIALNPTIIYGSRDYHLSTARIFKDMKISRIIPYSDGGVGVCDADEVAKAHIKAIEKGKNGHRYILNSENLTIKEYFSKVLQLLNHKAKLIYIPPSVFNLAGDILKLIETRLKNEPPITGDLLKYGAHRCFYDAEKAMKELDYKPIPSIESMHKSYEWVKSRKLIQL